MVGVEFCWDNVLVLVEFFKNFKSYDGEDDYLELYFNIFCFDIYLEMRNYIEDDIFDVVGYIFIVFKLDEWWGGIIYF